MRHEENYLGSNSRMSTSAGSAVANSTARYTPFGDWRTEPTAALTDRGYTGHLHNNLGSGSDDLGLIYMNARYYLPFSGRFISPDTIVPDSANPQSYNRYSYVENSPLNYTDPTGHMASACGNNNECGFEGNSWLGQWLGWDVVSDPAIPSVGVSLSASVNTPMVSVEANIGLEVAVDTPKGEATSFIVLGGDVSLGPDGGFVDWVKGLFSDGSPSPINITASLYGAAIHNVDNLVVDYSKVSKYDTTTASYGYGIMWGQSYSPSAIEGRKAYSEQAGLTTGYALTSDHGASYYIPLQTVDFQTGSTTYHNLLPYFQDLWSLITGG